MTANTMNATNPTSNTTKSEMTHANGHAARSVRFDLVKGKKADFTKLFNTEVLPMLRKQNGFKDEVLLVREDHVLGISLWNSKDALKSYETSVYPQIEKTLTPLMSGKPTIETYELAGV